MKLCIIYRSSLLSLDARLYDGNNVLDAVLAVLLQPFADDGNDAADIEGHHVLLILRGHAETVQDRRKRRSSGELRRAPASSGKRGGVP